MKVKHIPSTTDTFEYLNVNPKGKFVGDCVIRAIAAAENVSWTTVFNELCEIAQRKKEMPNSSSVYFEYLRKHGWELCKTPYMSGTRQRLTLNSFIRAEVSKNTKYICHISRHLTCVLDGKIRDTWNCGEWKLGKYFVKSI